MGTGYVRNDTSNNIADGNIINAADLDGEFDAIESAMGTSGHTHDGTSAEGGPVTVLGPVQDFVASATEIKPKTTNTLDIGTSGLLFKDMFLDGVATIGSIKIDNAGTIGSASDADAIAISSGGVVSFSQNTIGKTGSGYVLSLQTSDTTIEATNVLGKIEFSAPDEASGTDAILVGASIEALAEATFDSATNSTALVFKTNTTGAATERMRLTSAGDLHFLDNRKAIFGAGSDLQIYHDGSASYIQDTGTGALYLQGDGGVNIRNAAGTENKAVFASDGAVTLYHDNAAKFATTSTGIDVTGTVTADGLTVDGTSTLSSLVTLTGAAPRIEIYESDTTDVNSRIDSSGAALNLKTIADDGGSQKTRIKIGHSTGDISFYEDTGTTAKFFWDASAESLGIGTTSPRDVANYSIVGINGTSGSAIDFELGEALKTSLTQSAGQFEINVVPALPLLFKTSNTERMRITSAGHLQLSGSTDNVIRSGSDSSRVRIFGGSTESVGNGAALTLQGVSHSSGNYADLASATGGYINFRIGTSNAMRIDSSGNVGIGVVPSTWLSSSTALQIGSLALEDYTVNGANVSVIYNNAFRNTAGNIVYQETDFASSYSQYNGEHTFNVAASGTAGNTISFINAMRIDSSGNVGIGTSSPSSYGHSLVVAKDASGGATYATITNTNANQFLNLGINADVAEITWDNADSLAFGTTAASTDEGQTFEAMRIDSSGNLLVGKTTTPIADDGIQLSSGDYMSVTRTGAELMYLNRKGSGGTENGDIIKFYSNTAQVGSIGAVGGSVYIASPQGTDAGIQLGNSIVSPATTTGSNRDNAIDLGWSANRFKDLYLSGGVYLGGTGAANKLDDYEEGTFTPTIANLTNLTGTASITRAIYTKVGNLCTIQVKISGLTISSSATDTFFSATLPTAAAMDTASNPAITGVARATSFAATGVVVNYTNGNATQVSVAFPAENVGSSGAFDITYSLTYRTA